MSNKVSHTAGKWESFIQPTESGLTRTINVGTRRIATLSYDDSMSVDEYAANAKLIAAAPELLEAMQRQYLLHLIFMPSHYRNTVAGQDVLTMCLNSISTAMGKDHQAVQDYFEELSALVKSNEIQFSEAIKKATE